MTKTRKLREDIASLALQLTELTAAVEHAATEHEESQQQLVRTFNAENQQRAATCFAAYSSLKQAAEAVSRELEAKRQSLAAALTYEQQASAREHRARLEQQAEASLTTYKELRHKAAESLQAILPKAVAAWQEFLRCRRELGQLSGRVDNLGDLGCYQPIDLISQALLNESTRPTRAERKAAANERNRRERETRARENEKRNRPPEFDSLNRLNRPSRMPVIREAAKTAPGWTKVAVAGGNGSNGGSDDTTPEAA